MAHALPPDPRDVVLQWSTTGEDAAAASGPDLVVRADGSATAGGRFGSGRPVDAPIGAERLQALLDTIIDERGFFEINGGELERRMRIARDRRAAGGAAAADEALTVPLGPPYLDAADSRIVVCADGRRHEVVVQGLAAAAREYPELAGLADLRAVELALLELAVRIGSGQPP